MITRGKAWSVEEDSFLVKIRLASTIFPRYLLAMIRLSVPWNLHQLQDDRFGDNCNEKPFHF